MKDFLETVYKKCASSRACAIDEVLDTIGFLSGKKDFEKMNSIFLEVDLSKLDGGTMYSLCNFTSNYINVLPDYKTFVRRCREECARRGYTEKRIDNLYGKLENGGLHIYNPDDPPYVDPDTRDLAALDARIAEADAAGDKRLAIWLSAFKSYSTGHKERESKFHKLRHQLGDEELRKRTIKALRDMAELLESTSGCWPGIFYADLPDIHDLKSKTIDGLEVIVSYPWGG